jgi:hypothetical protein
MSPLVSAISSGLTSFIVTLIGSGGAFSKNGNNFVYGGGGNSGNYLELLVSGMTVGNFNTLKFVVGAGGQNSSDYNGLGPNPPVQANSGSPSYIYRGTSSIFIVAKAEGGKGGYNGSGAGNGYPHISGFIPWSGLTPLDPLTDNFIYNYQLNGMSFTTLIDKYGNYGGFPANFVPSYIYPSPAIGGSGYYGTYGRGGDGIRYPLSSGSDGVIIIQW